jgi:hypothetical protein
VLQPHSPVCLHEMLYVSFSLCIIYMYIIDSSKQKYYVWSNNCEVSYVIFIVISCFLPLLDENIFLGTQISKAVSLISSINMSAQISQPQKITGNIMILFPRVLIPTLLIIKKREKIVNRIVEKMAGLNCPYCFLQAMFNCSCHYEMLELYHTFTKFVSYHYIAILSCLLKLIPER